LAKQWPASFDEAVDELMIRYAEEAVVAVGDVGSPAAKVILKTRLDSLLDDASIPVEDV
jgi:predicted metal-dependent TIM-barrel fold hydrolase